ncbi:hypothetical protein DSCO28_06670 [Desulfosarcina ovata subsp. sediminis]|uniref:Type 4 fimbrial biogenesis protein PilX N-terminal domain-containing protein n=1 Tax=Desulfosarcina ovata subsp. sediminis TaxID=885957 RepID=A0A5K7ZGX9_9BACT|nr:hypothetical protein [Desulfosarcina ovata]BBO80101.1 hypothetical protein DSCO28_06670 [Desulfosarcina ovata subsp. sediminis]
MSKTDEEKMDLAFIENKLRNEDGIVAVVSLMLLVTLTIAGIAAINISNNETGIVRNEQLAAGELYDSESGINIARVNYLDWMTDIFLTAPETTASSTYDVKDNNGETVATLQIRCIENNNSGAVTPIFNNVADELPAVSHTALPPAGSGYSVKYFEARRYSITATSATGGTIVQAGVWKVFNKY